MHKIGWKQVVVSLALAAVALIAPRAMQAQSGKISGVVTDASSGQPVEGVQVVVQGTGLGSVSQPNGRYFIIGVPPGTYTVVARRIGYAPVEVSNVQVRIDATREQDFRLSTSATVLGTQRIVAEAAPLVERGTSSSGGAVTAEVIQALPVTDIAGVLQLQQGFLSVPQNTDIISFSSSRSNAISGVRIRGGRGGSTQTLIDGIPINNAVFGDRALDLNTFAVQQLDFLKGGMEPQYGNAISGVLNIATIEGQPQVKGAVEYQTTGLAGALGSRPDELRGYNLYRGFVSGPIPGTAAKLRYAVAGNYENGANSVTQFDNNTFSYERFNNGTVLAPNALDLFAGWRATGWNDTRDFFGKLTFLPIPAAKFNLTYLTYQRQYQPFDAEYRLVGFDPFSAPGTNTILDSLGLAGRRNYRDVVQASILADRQLYSGSGELRLGRTAMQLRVARFDQNRNTCNYFQGICLGNRFAQSGFEDGRFIAPNTGANAGNVVVGSDRFYGGEDVSSFITRFDAQSQVTDHHNLQAGLFYQRHDLQYSEVQNLGNNGVLRVPTFYAAKPYEAATYLQDRIEYDFLTVRLGMRFDYAKASGYGFSDPQDPTNGTTAREVCNGTATSLGFTTPFSYTDTKGTSDPSDDVTRSGIDACINSPVNAQNRAILLDSATRLAQGDDFTAAKARTAFSPRIQIAFPVTERSQFFANAGKYVQNPLYNNLYQNTGIGTTAGTQQGICPETEVKPGTGECAPIIGSDAFAPSYLGNPNLLLEQATTFELGYAAEFGRAYAANFVVFNRDETGLSGLRPNRTIQDIGSTYYRISIPGYNVIVNQDYATSRGVEMQFRRRLVNYWGYDINYSYSKATTNGPSPDLQQQEQTQGDLTPLREVRSEIDQPHVFNASLLLGVQSQAPRIRFGQYLRNSSLTITARAASGLPYTPTNNITGFGPNGRGEVLSERSPSTFQVDLQAGKNFTFSNIRYGAFLRVANLFDRKNCVQVFPTTGRCDAGVADQGRGRAGNNGSAILSSTQIDRPEYIGQRRSIYTGLRVNF